MIKVKDCHGVTVFIRYSSIISVYAFGNKTKMVLEFPPYSLVLNDNIDVITSMMEEYRTNTLPGKGGSE